MARQRFSTSNANAPAAEGPLYVALDYLELGAKPGDVIALPPDRAAIYLELGRVARYSETPAADLMPLDEEDAA